jgi:dolichol-phosphate mannosyltransferase
MDAQPRLGRARYSVVVPVYDEQEVLRELYERLGRVLASLDDPAEVVFVDDGSTDRSPEILRALQASDKRVRVVRLSRNFGHQAAITAGLAYAQGDMVAILDADLQDPPELLPTLFRTLEGGADVAYGVRYARKEGVAKRAAYFVFYRLLRAVAEVDIPADSGDFCAMTRRVVDHLNRLPESDRFVRGLRAWLGFRQVGVQYERDRRYAGVPKYTLLKLFKLSVDGLLSLSTAPLRLIAMIGLVISVLSFAGILVVLYRYLFTPYVPGYTSLAVLVLLMGGIQLFTLGIVGEYVARVSRQVKSRPSFVVAELAGFDSPEGK